MNTTVKKSFACASVGQYEIDSQLATSRTPQAGDVGIFKLIGGDGQYMKNETAGSFTLFDGDYIMAAFGNRYATNQYEGYVPDAPVQFCNLIARGGVAGMVKSINPTFKSKPLDLEWVGYAVDKTGEPINTIKKDALLPFQPEAIQSKVILSIGSSMDSGKTISAAYLAGGLAKAGETVAYIKLTGTAFPKDAELAKNRGAHLAIDFTELGFPSTYMCDLDTLLSLYQALVIKAQDMVQPSYIVMEIADGILQRETSMLLKHAGFMSTVHNVMMCCGDSLGVLSGLQILHRWGIHPFVLSGLFTASELLIREVEEALITPPVRRLEQLVQPDILHLLEHSPSYKNFKVHEAIEAFAQTDANEAIIRPLIPSGTQAQEAAIELAY